MIYVRSPFLRRVAKKLQPFLPTSIIFVLAIFLLANTLNAMEQASTNTPHNVMLIIADDLGVDVLSRYGEGSNFPPTDTLDDLFDEGILFRNAWATPICSPTRATLMTGRHGFRTGVGTIVGESDVLDMAEFSLPEAIDSEPSFGYTHANIGKWHLTQGGSRRTDPQTAGFDHYSGPAFNLGNDYFEWQKVTNGTVMTETEYATSVAAQDAIDWLDAQNQQNKPWFLWLAFNAPHAPWHLPPNTLHSYTSLTGDQAHIDANPELYYRAAVEAMDREIGRLLGTLPADVRDNTTIIFIGDNGTPSRVTESPFGGRHSKGSLNEGGVNVPLLISGKRVVNPGREVDAIVSSVDIYATVLELMGIDPSTNVPATIDSVSMMPYILDTATGSEREWVFTELFGSAASSNYGKTIRNATHKLIRYDDGNEDLFKVSTDPFENTDLLDDPLDSEGETNYCQLYKTMIELLETESGVTVPALPVICEAPDVGIALDTGTAVKLAWPNLSNNCTYEVHHSTTSNFTPLPSNVLNPPGTLPINSTETVINNMTGDSAVNNFFQLQPIACGAQVSTPMEVGEFDFDIEAGSP
ncbi:MAG: sulfatase-like hydrolase/transferase [Chloroflexota bacterium]